jgi:hypothetical protein
MARVLIEIVAVHADDTLCTHKVKPGGMPSDPASGCTGRMAFRVTCTACPGLDSKHTLRVLAEPAFDEHRRSHLRLRHPAPAAV